MIGSTCMTTILYTIVSGGQCPSSASPIVIIPTVVIKCPYMVCNILQTVEAICWTVTGTHAEGTGTGARY